MTKTFQEFAVAGMLLVGCAGVHPAGNGRIPAVRSRLAQMQFLKDGRRDFLDRLGR